MGKTVEQKKTSILFIDGLWAKKGSAIPFRLIFSCYSQDLGFSVSLETFQEFVIITECFWCKFRLLFHILAIWSSDTPLQWIRCPSYTSIHLWRVSGPTAKPTPLEYCKYSVRFQEIGSGYCSKAYPKDPEKLSQTRWNLMCGSPWRPASELCCNYLTDHYDHHLRSVRDTWKHIAGQPNDIAGTTGNSLKLPKSSKVVITGLKKKNCVNLGRQKIYILSQPGGLY